MVKSRRRLQRILRLDDVVNPPAGGRGSAQLDLRNDFQPPDCLAIAVRYLAEIVASGKSEASRVAAAKLLMDHAKNQAAAGGKGKIEPPIIHYIITGEEPPLGEGEYEAESSFNAFDVTYTNPQEAYNSGDAGRYRNEAAIAEDGEVRATTLDLPWVQSVHQAQRCARIHDAKANSRLRGYVVGGLSLIQAYGEMIINLSLNDCAALDGITVMPTKVEVLDLMAGKFKISFVEITEAAFDFAVEDYLDIDTGVSGGTGSSGITVPEIDDHEVSFVSSSPVALMHLDNSYRADMAYQVQYRTSPVAGWTILGVFGAVDDGGHADVTVYGLPSHATVYVQLRGYYSGGGGGPSTTAWGNAGDGYLMDLSGP